MRMVRSRVLLVALVAVCAFGAVCVHCRREASRADNTGAAVALPAPKTKGEVSLEEAIAKRRSIRAFSSQGLTMEEIGQLAWAAQGITESKRGLRAAPSAGALYPLEVYLVTREGAFHYLPQQHALERVGEGDLRSGLAAAASGQSSVANAPLDVVIAAVYERTTKKYGERGERYVHIEVGHAAENLLLQATAMGLGGVMVGAFADEAVSEALALPDDQTPLYIIPVGHPPE